MAVYNAVFVVFFSGIASAILSHLAMDLPAILSEWGPHDAAATAASVQVTRATYAFLTASPLHLGMLAALIVVGFIGAVHALRRAAAVDVAAVALFLAGGTAVLAVVLPHNEVLQAPATSADAQREHLAIIGYGHIVVVASSLAGLALQFVPVAGAPRLKKA